MTLQTILDTMDEGTVRAPTEGAEAWLGHHKSRFGGFVGGSWRKHKDAADADVLNPATGEKLAAVKVVGAKEVDAALKAARKAQPGWEGRARAASLRTWARKVRDEQDTLATLETLASGRPVRQTLQHDLPPLVTWLEHHAERTIALNDSFPGYEARGVVALIVDHPAPLRFALKTAAAALAAGCTVILVSTVDAPLALFRLADLARAAGIPEGVFNVVVGDAQTKTALASAEIDVLAYAGSDEAARTLYEQSAERDVARLVVLDDPRVVLVFEDADLDAAADGVLDALRANAPAGVRVLVQESVEAHFHRRLRERLATFQTGDPLDYRTDAGPLPNEVWTERLRSLMSQAEDLGATREQPAAPSVDRPAFVAPSLLAEVAPALPIAQSPLPGALILTQSFRTPSEALALIDQSRFASAVSVWSETQSVATTVAVRLEPPTIYLNSPAQTDPSAPQSFARHSGFGTLGAEEGLATFLRLPREEEVPSPTDKVSVKVSVPSTDDVEKALGTAKKAATWSRAPTDYRSRLLLSLADTLAQQAETLTNALIAATGQTRKDAEADVVTTLELAYAYATMPERGRLEPSHPTMLVVSDTVPHGVIGIVCPEVPPLLGLIGLTFPALLSGNRVVVAPSPRLGKEADEALKLITTMLPLGVLNVVRGDGATLAQTLVRHGDVAALWFFGEGGARADVARAAADTLTPLWAPDKPRGSFGVSLARRQETLRHATRRKTLWMSYGL